ncbi:MAG: metallophosphoesterase [Caldilineaceae bacterium]
MPTLTRLQRTIVEKFNTLSIPAPLGYHRTQQGFLWLLFGLTLALAAVCTLWLHTLAAPLGQDEALPALPAGRVEEVRTLLPSEWGIPHPAGLAYSPARNQLALLHKRHMTLPPTGFEQVAIVTPLEDLVASTVLSLTLESTINIAYDDVMGQLLLLNGAHQVARVPLLLDGGPDASALTQVNVSHLALTTAAGMAVDHAGRQLFILDGATAEIVVVRLDEALTLAGKIGLSHLGASTLRGLALHPLSHHFFMVDPVQGVLHEVEPQGRPVRQYALAALALIDPGGLAFGPSTDATDDPLTYHLFMADSNWPDPPPTSAAANAQPQDLPTAPAPIFGRVLELQIDVGQAPQTLRRRAAASSDDSEETIASGATTVDSSDLELGQTASGAQLVGIRFGAVTLPANAILQSAAIEFTTDEKGELPTSLQIRGEAVDSAAAFAEPNSDVSRRARTTASVNWPNVPPWLHIGERRRTPDLAPIVQEIMARPGWSNGNAVGFLISGSGQRTAEAYDGDPWSAPRLLLEYIIPMPTPAPTVTVTVTPTATPIVTSTVTPGVTETPAVMRIAVIGDYGRNNDAEASVAALVHGWNPDFVITVGDNNYPDGEASTIDDNVGQYYGRYIGNYTGAYGPGSPTNRFWPVLGNHDWHTIACDAVGCTGAYFDYFTLPNNERYYDVDLGLVHLFALDSEDAEPDGRTVGSVQAAWLRAQLAASAACYNLVYFHHAPYSSGKHGSNQAMQWPFAAWGADAILSGHDHLYERLDVNGAPYFVNGAGGAGLYSFDNLGNLPAEADSLVRDNQDFGAMLITADATSIVYHFYHADGLLIDEYASTKACANSPPSATPETTPVPTPSATPTASAGQATPTSGALTGETIMLFLPSIWH